MEISEESKVIHLLTQALQTRKLFFQEDCTLAFRFFNGFFEGDPDLVVDIYGTTLVLYSYCENEESSLLLLQFTRDFLLNHLPWIRCVIAKHRSAGSSAPREGSITFGSRPETQISEHRVQYAIELLMNQDASFYLDTRNLRKWLIDHAEGLDILNAFAYTGSLGIAALAGGASKVLQIDHNKKFLDLARRSAILNHMDLGKMKLSTVDFFVGVGQLKKRARVFDLVILDPPFFSITQKGKVDQLNESARLINKVRPLVRDGGRIIAINNALYLSGEEYCRSIEALGQAGFLTLEEIIPIPEDVTGDKNTQNSNPPEDPAPFNHPTKIAVLKVKRK
ncbi:MAG: class I SAM-dependent methyltransferase [Chloroflexi bacterium]|nr:class I SAM-dependent methyltransferase [Chloroflexota bacterium]